MRALRTLIRHLFAYDIFVSYARRDGTVYASELAAALTHRGYSCFFDRFEAIGADLVSQTMRALRHSRVLVVVGTPAAMESAAVRLEIERFVESRGTVIVIASVDVDGAAWAHSVKGTPVIVESEEALSRGSPSVAAISRIDVTLAFLRQQRRLQGTVLAVAIAGFVVAALMGILVNTFGFHYEEEPSASWWPTVVALIGGMLIGTGWQKLVRRRRSKQATTEARGIERAGAAAFLQPFISYSHKDGAFAKALERALAGHGVRCWLDDKDLKAGDDIHETVAKAIDDYDKLLLCCSAHSLRSWWVDNELGMAFQKEETLSQGKKPPVRVVIPLNLDGFLFEDAWSSGYKAQLRRRLAVDFTKWRNREVFNARVEQLTAALIANDSVQSPRNI